jgi:hypothetical protein
MRIPVYILPTDTPDGTKSLVDLFWKSKLFKVIEVPPQMKNIGLSDAATEADQVIDSLKSARKCFPDDYCIIIKDTSVTNSTTDEIVKIVLTAIDLNRDHRGCVMHKWQMCYLSRWLDRCDLYREEAEIKGVTKIVKTLSPFGIQAIMFSPEGRDIVLGKKKMRNGKYFPPISLPLGDQFNENIGEENINAICVVPNLFEFNVMMATNELDFLKLSECRFPSIDQMSSQPEEEFNPPGVIPFLWFLVVVGGVILLAWFFYQFIGKPRYSAGAQIIDPIRKAG